jgi:hypothetical protein
VRRYRIEKYNDELTRESCKMIEVEAVDGEGLQGNCKYWIIEHADFQNGFRQVETTHAWTSNLVAFCSAVHYKSDEKLKFL